VAIKLIAPAQAKDPKTVARFFDEARALSRLNHPNIVAVYDLGQLHDGAVFLEMELLSGTDLRGRMGAGPLPPDEIRRIFSGIAAGLSAAHRAGIVHRDLKPENVFLVMEDDGHVFPKLLDFGIAKLMSESGLGHKTRTGAPMGTPHYMSPEQCRGRNVDQRTDIYSFGIRRPP
jgi:serine/threonine-protein kinase